ncbi:MAG: hypothetical protein HOE11_02900 [Candidatus Diapherotrites archaeon]|jgi:hypothetical protein|nr:hypothetical protein [Candidatus Diapherotrites archaeon]MBT4596884.1 hypothetical protein [Candidatus Diapherotrites archaeon]
MSKTFRRNSAVNVGLFLLFLFSLFIIALSILSFLIAPLNLQLPIKAIELNFINLILLIGFNVILFIPAAIYFFAFIKNHWIKVSKQTLSFCYMLPFSTTYKTEEKGILGWIKYDFLKFIIKAKINKKDILGLIILKNKELIKFIDIKAVKEKISRENKNQIIGSGPYFPYNRLLSIREYRSLIIKTKKQSYIFPFENWSEKRVDLLIQELKENDFLVDIISKGANHTAKIKSFAKSLFLR